MKNKTLNLLKLFINNLKLKTLKYFSSVETNFPRTPKNEILETTDNRIPTVY